MSKVNFLFINNWVIFDFPGHAALQHKNNSRHVHAKHSYKCGTQPLSTTLLVVVYRFHGRSICIIGYTYHVQQVLLSNSNYIRYNCFTGSTLKVILNSQKGLFCECPSLLVNMLYIALQSSMPLLGDDKLRLTHAPTFLSEVSCLCH